MHFIVLIILLWLSFKFPAMLIGAAITIGILYYCDKLPDMLKDIMKKEEKSEEKPKDRRPGVMEDYVGDDGVIDWEAFYDDNAESMTRPGFRDDPEWQEGAKRLRKYMAKKRAEAEVEEKEELEREEQEKEVNFWRKV